MIQRFNVYKNFKGFLRQGTSPKALAISTTIGLMLGIFPVLGITTLLMMAISVRLRLNLPLMLAVSYLIYPFQILLMVPFIRLGEWISGTAPLGLSMESLEQAFRANFFKALQDLGMANLLAVAGWSVLAVPAGLLVYLLLVPFFRFLLQKQAVAEVA